MLIRKTVTDMHEVRWNINEEYEKIFGAAKRVNLFESEEEYDELRHFIINEPQEAFLFNQYPFEGIEIKIKEEKSKPLIEEISKMVIQSVLPERHYFFIKEKGLCDAKGYYNEELKYFFICKNSQVAYDTDFFYNINDTENARENFLKKACKEDGGHFRVKKDAKCRSASAAACYVLGYEADLSRWIDSEGKTLVDIYPEIFSTAIQKNISTSKIEPSSKKEQKQPSQKETNPSKSEVPEATPKVSKVGRTPIYFYITRDNIGDSSCYARGKYDNVNKKFILLAGSRLSSEVTPSYRYTASDIKRSKFIKLNCGIPKDKFLLTRDAICNSPDEAASFVLGEKADGWTEWKSQDEVSLGIYYNKESV